MTLRIALLMGLFFMGVGGCVAVPQYGKAGAPPAQVSSAGWVDAVIDAAGEELLGIPERPTKLLEFVVDDYKTRGEGALSISYSVTSGVHNVGHTRTFSGSLQHGTLVPASYVLYLNQDFKVLHDALVTVVVRNATGLSTKTITLAWKKSEWIVVGTTGVQEGTIDPVP